MSLVADRSSTYRYLPDNEQTKRRTTSLLLLQPISIERRYSHQDFLHSTMVLQAERQIDYLQRTLSIFLRNANDMREQFETLMDELISESKQQLNNKSPKQSPESSSSDSKSDALTNGNSPQPLTQKKRSATSAANSKPPPTKRLKSETTTSTKDDEEDEKKNSSDEETNDDDDDQDETKSKTVESQSTRDINEFAIEIGLVCNKCMVLTEEKDNRLVECHECHLRYHQRCHKPPVSTADISDPRSLWYCAKCRRSITKRQQSQSTIKEIKSNSNSSSSSSAATSSNSSTNKTKAPESILSSVKKGLTPSITDVTTGLFTLKAKSSDSLISDNNASHSANPLNSSNSSTNNNGTTTTTTATTKNTNGWASLVTGSKEKKSTTTTTTTESSSSIFNDLTSGTTNETKAAPSSPKSSLNKTSFNGGNLSLLKATSSTVLSTIKPTKPSSPPVLKTQLSSSTLKSSTKVLPTNKSIQRISSPTPLGRQTSTIKSPPVAPPTPSSTTNNNSRSNSSPSSTTTTTNNSNHLKIPSGLDCEKRLKKIRKLAAEKTLTKKY